MNKYVKYYLYSVATVLVILLGLYIQAGAWSCTPGAWFCFPWYIDLLIIVGSSFLWPVILVSVLYSLIRGGM